MGEVEALLRVHGPDWHARRSVRLTQVPRVGETVAVWPGVFLPGQRVTDENTPNARVTDVHWELPGTRVDVPGLSVEVALESTAVRAAVPNARLEDDGWTLG